MKNAKNTDNEIDKNNDKSSKKSVTGENRKMHKPIRGLPRI